MFNTPRIFKSATLVLGLCTAGAASAMPVTFQLNDDNPDFNGQFFSGLTATTTSGDLTLTLEAFGDTATNLRESGGTEQSGLAVFSTVDTGGTFINNPGGEGIRFSFTNSSGEIAVDVLSLELSRFGSTGETATVNVGATSTVLTNGSSESAESYSLALTPRLEAGEKGELLAGLGTTLRFHSLTVQAIPEPGTALLAATGLLLVAARRRRA